MASRPYFLQGIYPFEGRGLDQPFLLHPELTYLVPRDTEAQLVYFRGGNSSDELVTAIVMRDGKPMRLFPLGAKSGADMPLRIVEDLLAETRLEVHLAAPAVSGRLVIDIGLVEVG
jgi:assimilatory nitrate reductase catalytic subunit